MNEEQLYHRIRRIILDTKVIINSTIVFANVESNWRIDQTIVEQEQGGAHWAEYSSNLLKHLSIDFKKRLGKGFALSSLSNMRKFYGCFLIFDAPRQKLSWIAKYCPLNESKQLVASRYKLYLPSEEELRQGLGRECHIIQQQN